MRRVLCVASSGAIGFQPDDSQDGLAASRVCPIDGVIVMQPCNMGIENSRAARSPGHLPLRRW